MFNLGKQAARLHPNTLKRGVYPGSGMPSGAQISRGPMNMGATPRAAQTLAMAAGRVAAKPIVQQVQPRAAYSSPAPRTANGAVQILVPGTIAPNGAVSGITDHGQSAPPAEKPPVAKPPVGPADPNAHYHDSEYDLQLAALQGNTEQQQLPLKDALSNAETMLPDVMKAIKNAFEQSVNRDYSSLAGRGLFRSGAREISDLNRTRSNDQSLKQADMQYGSVFQQQTRTRLQSLMDAMAKQKIALELQAKERWQDQNPAGKAIPKGAPKGQAFRTWWEQHPSMWKKDLDDVLAAYRKTIPKKKPPVKDNPLARETKRDDAPAVKSGPKTELKPVVSTVDQTKRKKKSNA